MDCRCGCHTPLEGKRTFVDMEHQLAWMNAGGARQIGTVGGQVTGRQQADLAQRLRGDSMAPREGRVEGAARRGGAYCRCGCDSPVVGKRVFVNKEHQLAWMNGGGAREMGALEPLEARQLGGQIAGRLGTESGALARAGLKGAERAHEIAVEYRRKTQRQVP